MKILTIIVTYNAMQWAERCFSSLYSSTIVPDIFVVDNGSKDGTQAYIKKEHPNIIFHQSVENLGFGQANNMGLQYALAHNYDYVYLLNQDAWVSPDTFEHLIKISTQYPQYGILSPFQMNADMLHIDRNFIVNVLSWKSNPDICSDLYSQRLNDVYSVCGVMAAHWFLPIATIKKVGGFSPTFHHYTEDDNYIDRVHFWGYKIGVVPSLRVVHDRGWREDTKSKKMYLSYTGMLQFLSNPLKKQRHIAVWLIYTCLKHTIKFKSFKPIKYTSQIIRNYQSIINNKQISMRQERAFL